MINFVCVKWGTLYGPEYVNILYDMVRRNLSAETEGRFICFTDDPHGLDAGIKTKELPLGLVGWWNKLALFAPDMFPAGERVIYLDLDTVITSGLDDIIKYEGDFAILRDFYRPNGWQSSFMAWRAGFGYHIWEEFNKQGRPNIDGGDQIFIERTVQYADIWQDMFPGSFVSYKVHAKYQIPKTASVVIFHGHPRPHEVTTGWVPEIWKIGGGSALELKSVGNTNEEILIQNIEHACSLGLENLKSHEAHDGHAVIVGGGPSLKDLSYIEEIRQRKANGQTIIAVNASWVCLLINGIEADVHVLLDGRKENVSFVPLNPNIKRYYASQCDREVFNRVHNITLWHHVSASNVIKNNKDIEVIVAGGSTVGLNAMCIAYLLGYRKLHLYGFDSSYDGDKHHAYYQPLNDNEQIIDVTCGNRSFKAAPWMAEQVEQFRDLAPQLCNLGCEITVHGDGLLPHCAQMMLEMEPFDDIVEVEGVYWPSEDRMSRQYVLGTLSDIDHILSFVTNHHVAIQAGGHVGLWPKEFSKYFNAVYTFEPDNINFQCLARNCKESNIIKFQAALGDSSQFISLDINPRNAGAHSVGQGGIIPTIRIDDLHLEECDLIQLDIEGYELKALKGAEKTIKKFKPVIVVEDKGLSEKYGVLKGEIEKWLGQLGYKIASRIHRDLIFIKA